MKINKLQSLKKQLINPKEEQRVKGGYGRTLGRRIRSRNSRWDDVPFRTLSPLNGNMQKEARGRLGK